MERLLKIEILLSLFVIALAAGCGKGSDSNNGDAHPIVPQQDMGEESPIVAQQDMGDERDAPDAASPEPPASSPPATDSGAGLEDDSISGSPAPQGGKVYCQVAAQQQCAIYDARTDEAFDASKNACSTQGGSIVSSCSGTRYCVQRVQGLTTTLYTSNRHLTRELQRTLCDAVGGNFVN